MNIPTLTQLRGGIVRSIKLLKHNDGSLFEMPNEDHAPKELRKLHEVCINHKLAEYLSAEILPRLDLPERMFVDIEFNREGINSKQTIIEGEDNEVRPDIIVHNRKSDADKLNLLIVECKKSVANEVAIQRDVNKIKALMTDPRYDYHFGLQVIYGSSSILGTLFYKHEDGSIKEEPIAA